MSRVSRVLTSFWRCNGSCTAAASLRPLLFPASLQTRLSASTWRSPSIGVFVRTLAAKSLPVPEMGESIREGTVAEWHVDEGEGVKEDQVLVQLETDKIVVDVRAESSGVLVERTASEGDVVAVGEQLGLIDYEATAEPSSSSENLESTTDSKPDGQKSSPKVTESSKDSEKDSEKASEREQQSESVSKKQEKDSQTPSDKPKERTKSSPQREKGKPVEVSPPRNLTDSGERRVTMTRMRKRIAERLKEAQNTAAMLTTFNEVDMSALMDLRSEYKDVFEKRHGARLGYMSAFVKACTVALQEQPEVNGFIDGDDIVYRDYVDISVAVSTPKGLVVPALRGCENMNFAAIEKTIASLGERARTGELTLEEMQGGTFTISNGGVFGSLLSTPILNMPQSAILGMHIIQKRPVVIDNQVVIRPMMYVALSYDHRLIDGREAVTFLRRVKNLIEDPRRLLLEVDL